MTATLKTLQIAELMKSSGVMFGTSGARGLADDMRNYVCYVYTLAFLQYLLESGQIQVGDSVAVAGDFRPSSPRIMNAVTHAIVDAGCQPINTGFIPTPAVACFAIKRGMACIMVTGSHIPDDRNGIKFYKPAGEILKDDEQALCSRSVDISQSLLEKDDEDWQALLPPVQDQAQREYVQRYLNFFPADCLQGLSIGIYEHSTVLRDIMAEIIGSLGAKIMHLGRSEHFIPVDTEAIRPEDVVLARDWSAEYALDAIVSADGDGDRPLISNEHGQWLRGDVAGVFCAYYLQAKHVVTPISSNTAVEKSAWFEQVDRTRIGSPFVIAAMNQAMSQGKLSVVGYEANGGFLTGTDILLNHQTLSALPTRDAMLVPLAILMLAKASGTTISGLNSLLPGRFTSSGRLKDFPNDVSQSKLKALLSKDAAEAAFKDAFGEIESMDDTDGVRMTFVSGEIVHLRGSGNAPELRCYNEADSEMRAIEMNEMCLRLLNTWR